MKLSIFLLVVALAGAAWAQQVSRSELAQAQGRRGGRDPSANLFAEKTQRDSRGNSKRVNQARQINGLRKDAAKSVVDLLAAQQKAQRAQLLREARRNSRPQYINQQLPQIVQAPLQQQPQVVLVQQQQPQPQLVLAQPQQIQPQVVLAQPQPIQPQVVFAPQPAPFIDPFAQAPLLNQFAPLAPLTAFQLAQQAQLVGSTPLELAQAIQQAQYQPYALADIANQANLEPFQLAQLVQQANLAAQSGQDIFALAQQATYAPWVQQPLSPFFPQQPQQFIDPFAQFQQQQAFLPQYQQQAFAPLVPQFAAQSPFLNSLYAQPAPLFQQQVTPFLNPYTSPYFNPIFSQRAISPRFGRQGRGFGGRRQQGGLVRNVQNLLQSIGL